MARNVDPSEVIQELTLQLAAALTQQTMTSIALRHAETELAEARIAFAQGVMIDNGTLVADETPDGP